MSKRSGNIQGSLNNFTFFGPYMVTISKNDPKKRWQLSDQIGTVKP